MKKILKALIEGRKAIYFVMAVTFVSVAFVSGIQIMTRDMVASNELLYLKKAVAEASGKNIDGKSMNEWFDSSVSYRKGIYLVAGANGKPSVSVLIQKGNGLWGTITAAVGVDISDMWITGVSFISHNETPGLGARIEEQSFKSQFRGKKGPFALSGETGTGVDQIDAITGATITSKAVRDIMNDAVLHVQKEISPALNGEK